MIDYWRVRISMGWGCGGVGIVVLQPKSRLRIRKLEAQGPSNSFLKAGKFPPQ
jgi:hypothetical protein